ncbi:hypothetical protein IAT40_003939 [Kwoniella sp. CBS 6097]
MSSALPYLLTPTIRPSPSLITFDSPTLQPVSLLDIDNYDVISEEFIDRLLGQRSLSPSPTPTPVPQPERESEVIPALSALDPFADAFTPTTARPQVQSNTPTITTRVPVYQAKTSGPTSHSRAGASIYGIEPLSFSSQTQQRAQGSDRARFVHTQKAIRVDRGRSASPAPRSNLGRFNLGRSNLPFSPHQFATTSSPSRAPKTARFSTPPPLIDYRKIQSQSETQDELYPDLYPSSTLRSSSPTSSIASTPDLTPDTSFSSADRRVHFTHPSSDSDADDSVTSGDSILLSDPSELIGLFRLDIQPLPYPTSSLVSKPEVKKLPPKVEAALLKFDQDNNETDNHQYQRFPDQRETGRAERLVELQNFRQVVDPLGEPLQQDDLDLDPDSEEYEEEYAAAADDLLVDISPGTESVNSSQTSWKSSIDYQDLIDSSLAKFKSTYHSPKPRRPGEKGYNDNVMSLLDSTSTNGSTSSTSSKRSRNATPRSTRSADTEAAVHAISPYQLLLANPSPRLTVPPELLNPSTPDTLQTGIMGSWVKTEPSKESKLYKKEFLKTLTNLVNGRFGNLKLKDGSPRFKVDVFGSVSWGGETGKSGDLDLVILDRALPQGYRPSLWRQPPDTPSLPSNGNGRRNVPTHIAGLPRIYHTYALAECLRYAGMRDVQPIPGASTPIVKFTEIGPETLECDINANDLGGWYNSSLILHYCLQSPHLLRPLIHVLKLWASAHNLNDASGSKGPATMSSYCLTLLAIAYLQHRGCLPNLQADINVPPISRPADEDPDVVWVSWSKDQGVPAHVAFARAPSAGWKSAEPDLTVADALRGFFAFFSSTPAGSAQAVERKRFNHKTEIVSTIQGGIAKRVRAVGADKVEEDQLRAQMQRDGYNSNEVQAVMDHLRAKRIEDEAEMGKGDRGIQPRNWSERRLVVQDPFLWAKNCAGMMSKSGLDRWFDCVDRAHRLFLLRGKEATIEELLYNPMPITPAMAMRGRGRGRGSPLPFGVGRGGPRW